MAILATFAVSFGVGQVSAATQVIFQEDFEASWPGSWAVGDDVATSGDDYWGVTTYRSSQGTHSAWCAQVGTNSGNGQPNSGLHYYDTNMGAYMDTSLGGISGYDSVTLSFYYWAVTGSWSWGDNLEVLAWDGSIWTQIWTQPSLSSNGWQFASVGVPLTTTILSFYFVSDPTVGLGPYEGAYVDDIIVTASDAVAPTSSVSSLPAYTHTASLSVPYTASDSGSGINYVELYYRLGSTGSFSKYATTGNPSGHWTSSPITFDSTLTGGDGLYQYYTIATDKYANVETAPGTPDASITVDTVAPSTLHSISGTTGSNGWYISSVSVTLVSGDSTSGVASTTYQIDSGGWQTYGSSFSYSNEGNHLLEYYATDHAGNSESLKSTPLKIDTSDPVLSTAVSGDGGPNGWWIGTSVTVNLSATDSASGVTSMSYSIDGGGYQSYVDEFQVTKEGTTSLECYATDVAGRSCIHTVTSFKLDTSDPVTQAVLTGGHWGQWYNSPDHLVLQATDPVSGVNWTQYRLDGGSWQQYTDAFLLTDDGIHTIEYYSQDNAGRSEAIRNSTFYIDKTAPVTQPTLTGDPGWNQWYVSSVSLNLEPTDNTSGVNWTHYSIDGKLTWQQYSGLVNFTSDGIYVVWFGTQDNASNSEISHSVTIYIDTTLPSLAIDLVNDTKFTTDSVVVPFTSSDAASGVNQTEWSLDSGRWQLCTSDSISLTGLSDGLHLLEFKTTDNAGNIITKSVTFRVNTNVFSMSGPMGPWLDIGLIVVALVVVSLLILWLTRRRAKAVPSEPENAKPD
jgi:hypothetical protein